MPAPNSVAPMVPWIQALKQDKGAGVRKAIVMPVLDNGGANTTTAMFVAPEDGYIHSIEFVTGSNVAVNDTNFASFAFEKMNNLGTEYSIVDYNADPANTTKATGGAPLVNYQRRILKITATKDKLKVKAGDVFRFRLVTGTGVAVGAGNSVTVRLNP